MFKKKVDSGNPKPVKGHFGESPEFVNEETGVKAPKLPIKSKRRKPKFKV